jgi:hypothetical protein
MLHNSSPGNGEWGVGSGELGVGSWELGVGSWGESTRHPQKLDFHLDKARVLDSFADMSIGKYS